MSNGGAALRGVAAAVLWAAVTVTLLANTVGGAIAGTAPRTGLGAFVDLLAHFLATMVAVAAATGAILGLVSRPVALFPPLRVVFLMVVAVPTHLLVLAATCTVVSVGAGAVPTPSYAVSTSPGGAWSSRPRFATMAAVLLVTASVTIALLEGWTRPAALPQTGLARPEVRRWFIWGLVALSVVLGSVAVARAA